MQGIEAGWWHIRATARKPNGCVQAVYSKSYLCDKAEELIEARTAFKQVLLDAGFSNITITHTERSTYRMYNHYIW